MHKALFFNANQFITLVLAYKTKYSLYLLRVCGVTVVYDRENKILVTYSN